MSALLLLASLLLFVFSLTPRLPAKPSMLIDLPSHFVVQYSVGAMILFASALFLHAPLAAALNVANFLLNFFELKDYLPRNIPAQEGGARLKILQANLLKSNRNVDALRQLILAEKPDIVTCCEVTDPFAGMLQSLQEEYPHQLITTGRKGYRVALLSRLPFLKVEQTAFGDARTQAIVFQVAPDGKKIDGVSLHPFTPIANIRSRDGEFSEIAARFAAEKPERLVLMGDFNATPWCPAMKRLVKTLELRNARLRRGIQTSWPSFFPFLCRIPIDHVLLSANLGVADFHVGCLEGSDHMPTLTVLYLK